MRRRNLLLQSVIWKSVGMKPFLTSMKQGNRNLESATKQANVPRKRRLLHKVRPDPSAPLPLYLGCPVEYRRIVPVPPNLPCSVDIERTINPTIQPDPGNPNIYRYVSTQYTIHVQWTNPQVVCRRKLIAQGCTLLWVTKGNTVMTLLRYTVTN